ncbi:MAG TPA: transcription elongation factor GreA [Candidatus Limnocylindrales bacterium]|nr:transcription elongation factor GreA [Candidatus Limnocylindrales bacterium]
MSAPELLRSAGLTVDGPVVWGSQIASQPSGVFVVEAPSPSTEAPLDHKVIRGWLERVPGLRLDGKLPTPHTLAEHLATLWLPDVPVLYIGRSTRALSARIASMYATPLGDSKPHPGGYLLKTLSTLSHLRIWWAETEAHEEFEDALLAGFAKLAKGDAVPFANAKPRLVNQLREPPARSAATQQADLRASAQKERRAVARGTRRTAVRVVAGVRPATAPNYVSQEGRDQLAAELDNLRLVVRPEVIARVKAAREHGDLKENAEYEYARKEQSFVEGRIQQIEGQLRNAVVVDESASTDSVGLGSTVVVEVDGDEERYVVVSQLEADPARGRISNVSPVGRALFGRRAGEAVIAVAPGGEVTYLIKQID